MRGLGSRPGNERVAVEGGSWLGVEVDPLAVDQLDGFDGFALGANIDGLDPYPLRTTDKLSECEGEQQSGNDAAVFHGNYPPTGFLPREATPCWSIGRHAFVARGQHVLGS